MSVAKALSSGAQRLAAAGVEDAALEAEVLLRFVLGMDREALLQVLRQPMNEEQACRFEAALQRRLDHEPPAYITGRRDFFGLALEVTPAVLIPRPETEILVEAAIELARPRSRIRRGPVIADIGTGSGAVAITLALNVARSDVYGIDVSAEALAVAERNAARHGVEERILFLRGDLLSPLPEYADLLVANLPYVTTADWAELPPEIRDHEPRAALDGGPDGLDVIRRFLEEAPRFLRPNGCVCLEFGAGQAGAVLELARSSLPGLSAAVRKDLAGHDRVLVVSP